MAQWYVVGLSVEINTLQYNNLYNMFGLGISEIAIIGVVALILLFGSKKVVEIARSLGRVGGEFKKGQREVEDELRSLDATNTTNTNPVTPDEIDKSSEVK